MIISFCLISGLQNFQAIDIGNCNHLEKREKPILNFCKRKFLQKFIIIDRFSLLFIFRLIIPKASIHYWLSQFPF